MTGSPRPNLGGLFNGTVPPERARINGAPVLTVAPAPKETSPSAAGRDSIPVSGRSTAEPQHWLDPVNAVEQYFALLRALLDVNRDIAVACTKAVLSLPQRVGLRR